MLKEYALIPDIFDETCYSTVNLCPAFLNQIREVVLNEALVTNLSMGEWSKYLTSNDGRFHRSGKELIKTLRKESRLCKRDKALSQIPENDITWGDEAMASHARVNLDGIIVSHSNIHHFSSHLFVSSIEELDRSSWWAERSPSIRLPRNINEYLASLRLVLQHSNSIMFIDPNLDPTQSNYREFGQLLTACGRANPNLLPKIEIHRKCFIASGSNRRIILNSEWESSFQRVLAPVFHPHSINAEVFIWDDFHDRYIISNLIGVSVPNGFDTTTDPNSWTTWTRLGRKDRDDVQREFDPAAKQHDLKHRFMII